MTSNPMIAALFGDTGAALIPPPIPGGLLIQLTLQQLIDIQEYHEFIALRDARNVEEITIDEFRMRLFELMNRIYSVQPLSQD